MADTQPTSLTADEEKNLHQLGTDLENDPIYQAAITRMADETKRDQAELNNPDTRVAARQKVASAGGQQLVDEFVKLEKKDIPDINPANAANYNEALGTLLRNNILSKEGVKPPVFGPPTPIDGPPAPVPAKQPAAPATTPVNSAAPDSPAAVQAAQDEEAKRKNEEYGVLLDYAVGKDGIGGMIKGEFRDTIIQVMAMIDTLMGGQLEKKAQEIEIAEAVQNPQGRQAIATATLGPVGIVAEVVAETTIVPAAQKGMAALADAAKANPVGQAIADVGSQAVSDMGTFMKNPNNEKQVNTIIAQLKAAAGQNVNPTDVTVAPHKTGAPLPVPGAQKEVAMGGPSGGN